MELYAELFYAIIPTLFPTFSCSAIPISVVLMFYHDM